MRRGGMTRNGEALTKMLDVKILKKKRQIP